MWARLRGISFWFIWIEHSDIVFHIKECWQQEKLQSLVWEALMDYVKLEWNRTLVRIHTFLQLEHDYLSSFDKTWG
jgi:hypothetical protein